MCCADVLGYMLPVATKDALRKGANKFLNLVMTVMNAQITGASNADVLGRHAVRYR